MKKQGKEQAIAGDRLKASEQVRKNCIAELKHFRGVVHQTLASFQLKVEGEIEQVIELFLNRKTGVTDEEIITAKKVVDDMVGALKRLKIKSNKGRKKDIKKIEAVIEMLRDKTDTIT